MQPRYFRKKPVVIQAIQFVDPGMYPDIMKFCHNAEVRMQSDGNFNFRLVIPTLEGEMIANKGDWIIKGVKGEFYPCKPDIFEATYEMTNPHAEKMI